MEYALLAVIAAVIGGGVAGGLTVTWRLHLRLYSLESQVEQRRMQHAAKARWTKDEELAQLMMQAKKRPSQEEPYANDYGFPREYR